MLREQPMRNTMDPGAYEKTWLCPTPEDRARVLDMERRLKPLRSLTFGSLGLALLIALPWAGWWPLPLTGLALAGFVVASRRMPGARRPEYLAMLAWLLSVGIVAMGCIATGGLRGPAGPWLAIPAVALAVRFRLRGVIAGSVLTSAIMVVIALTTNGAFHSPLPSFLWLTADIALIVSNVGYTLALLGSDLHHRGEALIDPLTGLLNRKALEARVAELSEQARVNRQPVALVVGDLDHFKSINDRHGHVIGDAVLRAAAYRIRTVLRAYDLAYRLGGEEFLVVLPGADPTDAAAVAESLRAGIDAEDAEGIRFTMSFGVSASDGGEFDFAAVFERADAALYVAKSEGRNRVHLDDAPATRGTALAA